MPTKKPKFSDQLRRAVDADERSRYRLCKLLGITESTMSRFMAGGWLGVENIDALADLLGLRIESNKPAGKPAKKGK